MEHLIQEIVTEVKNVPGVKAIVLGGSRARGTNTPSSVIDLGIYYVPSHPLNMEELSRVASNLDDERRNGVITAIGGWGPWINGGGWLRIQSTPVDFLYRDAEKVNAVIASCLSGNVEIVYQPGHPLGFISSIYLGEIAICRPLWDPEELISELKSRIIPYPEALKIALVQKFAWEFDFSIEIARKSIERADVTYAAGCCFRSIMCMLQVLFALNEEYWLNEKGAVAIANGFEIKPVSFQSRVEEIFRSLHPAPESLRTTVTRLEELGSEMSVLLH